MPKLKELQLPDQPEINANIFGSVVGFAAGFMGGEVINAFGRAAEIMEHDISPVATATVLALGLTALLRREIAQDRD